MRQEAQCGIAAPPGLVSAAFVVEHQRRVEIQQRGPHDVLFVLETHASLGEEFKRKKRLALLVCRDAEEGQSDAGAVSDREFQDRGDN